MLKKSRVFLSCMALAGAGFGAAAGFGAGEARAAEMIRPEDEALLADIFAPADSAEASGGRAAVSGQEDGSGTEMKGARAASRVQAVPLKVTRTVPADKTVAGKSAVSAESAGGNATAVKAGTSLKAAVKEMSGAVEMNNATTGNADTGSGMPTATGGAGTRGTAGGTEEIIYVYPNKSERETARAPLDEWYDAAQHRYKTGSGKGTAAGGGVAAENSGAAEREGGAGTGADRATGASGRAEDGAEIAAYREQIASCLDARADGLDLEKAMLYQGNVYDAAVYLSQTFAEVNACYENIGYDIINAYYDGNPEILTAFAKKAQSFYVGGADTGFNPKFCGEDCSMQAIADAQMEQYAAFRTYLAQLLAERPQGDLTGVRGEPTSRPQGQLTGPQGQLTEPQGRLTGAQGRLTGAQGQPAERQGPSTEPQGE